jgi:hypothetical protein
LTRLCFWGPVMIFPPASAPSRLTEMRAVGSPSNHATPQKLFAIGHMLFVDLGWFDYRGEKGAKRGRVVIQSLRFNPKLN